MALRDAHLAMCFAPTAPLLEEDKTCPDAFISSLVLSSSAPTRPDPSLSPAILPLPPSPLHLPSPSCVATPGLSVLGTCCGQDSFS